MAYFRLEPWDEQRADLRAAIIASTIANVHRPKDRRPFRPKDFMPYLEPEDPRALSERIKQAFKQLDGNETRKPGR